MSDLILPTPLYLCALLALACVLTFRRERTWARLRLPLLALLLWSYCASTPAVASALIASLERQHPPVTATQPPEDDALIVVLSSGLTVETPSGYAVRLDRAAWERTFAGVRLWRAVGGRLLFVGEPTPDGKSSVAATMAEVATASGVPSSSVLVETRSRDTWENLAFIRTLAAGHGGRPWLVTSALHLPRALAVAHKLGLEPRPFPCDYRAIPLRHWYAWLPASGGPLMFGEALHEWIGLLYYRVKGYA